MTKCVRSFEISPEGSEGAYLRARVCEGGEMCVRYFLEGYALASATSVTKCATNRSRQKSA